jgi:hypothetical protein
MDGGEVMKELIKALSRHLQVIAVLGSAEGLVTLMTNLTVMVAEKAERLDAMHEALISSLKLQKDFAEQGIFESEKVTDES